MVLAIGNSGSYEVQAFQLVVSALEHFGESAVLFRQDCCLEGDVISTVLEHGELETFVSIDGTRYRTADFSSIWYLKPHLPQELRKYEPAEHRLFIHRQFSQQRQSLWTSLRHKKWLNDPWAMFIAEDKVYQMAIALRVGMVVPETVITSDPDLVRDFYTRKNGQVVVKQLAPSPITDHVIYTNIVTPDHMKGIDSLRSAPAIFQELVPKLYELRVTVVGREVFAAKIHSQSDPETAIDWRRKPLLNDTEVKMEQVDLPSEVNAMLLRFMDAIGLRFGCFDFIVTPSGEYVFLEVNPNGQWYFVQLRTGAAIAEAIAGALI